MNSRKFRQQQAAAFLSPARRPTTGRISSRQSRDIVHAAGVDFVRPPRGRISFPILPGQTPPPLFGKTIFPAQKRHDFFQSMGIYKSPWRFPMNTLPLFPPDAGITISTLRVDDIRLCRTISTPAAWTIFASRGSQTMKPRNLFGFGASFTLAAIYSRGTCRPTTIDVLMFHFRVRNGTGWGHQAMTTRLLSYSLPRSSLLRNS